MSNTISFDEPTQLAVVSETFEDEGTRGEWVKERESVMATDIHIAEGTITFENSELGEVLLVSSDCFIQCWSRGFDG